MKTIGKNGKLMINVYVVWCFDGPIMTTLLQYEDEQSDREAMSNWNTDQWISQAFDAEFNESMPQGVSYELAAVFTGDNITFLY